MALYSQVDGFEMALRWPWGGLLALWVAGSGLCLGKVGYALKRQQILKDVPPGPYQLLVAISDSAYTGNRIIDRFQRRTTASAKEDVVVPDEMTSSVPVDLGTFSVQPSLSVHN